ncbi:MAG: tRNA (cytidine(34)-2'-O)-methyltransferase [Lysobacterales bacterium]|jgi:tRNA (cytidine/uridine-2'-O-)-methyltransferase
MLHVILFEPEIPPNTGNVIRLCANTGSCLHLIEPLGFQLSEAKLRRAGLDYREWADVRTWPDWSAYVEQNPTTRLWAFSTRGEKRYNEVSYRDGDGLLFGPESRGLPGELRETLNRDQVLRLPMVENSRSLNLSNAVAVSVYEALRQTGFAGLC